MIYQISIELFQVLIILLIAIRLIDHLCQSLILSEINEQLKDFMKQQQLWSEGEVTRVLKLNIPIQIRKDAI